MSTTYTDPVVLVQRLIARSDHFRSWCGILAGTEAEKLATALEHIHIEGVEPEKIITPFAVVEPGDFRAMRVGMGGGCFDRAQSVLVTFGKAAVSTSLAEIIAEKLVYKEEVRAIISDLLAASGTGTHISFNTLSQRHPAQLTAESARERYWLWDFEISGDLQGSETV